MSEKSNELLRHIWRSRFVQSLISDEMFYRIKYRQLVGKKLNLKNPKRLSEKLQWLKLHDRKEIYHMMADKVAVRDYIAEKLGEEYLIPQYGVYDSFQAIDFDRLPDQFVMKPNHSSGDIFICLEKADLDLKALEKQVERWLKRDYFEVHREWPYKGIRPKIICQQYLDDGSEFGLKDYKFRAFHGQVKIACVCSERDSSTGLKVDYYDLDWKLLPFTRKYPNSGKVQPKPETFDKMVEFAAILSKDLLFSRIDFYEVNRQLFFGEITFYPASGYYHFNPDSYDEILGNELKLPIE